MTHPKILRAASLPFALPDRGVVSVAAVASLLVTLSGCRDDPAALADPEPEPEIVETLVGEYLDALPTWSEFSPPLPSQDPAPVDGTMPVQTEETVPGVTVVNEDGSVEVLGDITYDCTEVPFSMAGNPGEIIITDPNRDVLYPGAFIQGRTHRDGISIGDILPLTINKRAKVRVSIPDVSNPDSENYREVQPNQAEIAQAVGDIIGNATRDDLNTPSSISFDMQSFHSEKQFALSAGISGRYLGFKGSASGSVEQSAATTTVAVQFTQRMFTVVVEPPGAGPESFFAEDFTGDDLDAHIEAGRMGPDNLPVYVSSVVYGRMMTFAMTSTASESEIRAALRASYDSIAGGVAVDLSAKHQAVLEQSSVVLTTLGGDAADALGVIRSGDWSAYFGNEAALSTAVPLSYTFKNLGDNSIASVSESTDYTVKTCQARQATPGVFEPPAVQAFDLGMDTVSEVIAADINGDGLDDLVFNGRGGRNQVAVLLGTDDGVLDQPSGWESPGAPQAATWNLYQLQAGDVDGDGDDDLVWNHNGACTPADICMGNTFHVALANGDAAGDEPRFSNLPAQQSVYPQSSAGRYPLHLADINADGMADPIVQSSSLYYGTTNHHLVYPGLALGAGQFTVSDTPAAIDIWVSGEANVGFASDVIADFNGDGQADLLWNRLDGPTGENNLNVLLSRADASQLPQDAQLSNLFEWPLPQDLPPLGPEVGNWGDYRVLAGDVDDDGQDELVWAAHDEGTVNLRFVRRVGDSFAQGSASTMQLNTESPPESIEFKLADVAGSDRIDLVANQRQGAINRVFVGLSNGDGTFDDSVAAQTIAGDEAWSQFDLLTGNFGGSDKQDLAWVVRTNETRVYIAIAR